MEKQYQILNLLIKQQPLTAQQIADSLGLSPRTIKTYIKKINEEFKTTVLIKSSHQGYSVDLAQAQSALKLFSNNSDKFNREKELSHILLTGEKTFNIYDLSEQLYYSESTIRKDLKNLKMYFKQFDIALTINGDNVLISGSEINKRKIISDLIYKESNSNFVNIDYLQTNFKEIDMIGLDKLVRQEIKLAHLFINDYSLTNLILHLAITIDRLQNGNYSISQMDTVETSPEYKVAVNLATKLSKIYQITFSKDEIFELSLLLSSRVSHLNDLNAISGNLVDYIGENCLELVDKIFKGIDLNYGIEIDDLDLKIRFGLHLSNLITRSQNNYFSKNPLAQDFKASCPLIFEVAVYISSIIKKALEIPINNDEIAYIAFHIGNAIEASRTIKNKIQAILFSPNYYDLNQHLVEQLTDAFADDIVIKDLITTKANLTYLEDIDLIIATVPLQTAEQVEILQIIPFFNKTSQKQLQMKIEHLKLEKAKIIFKKHVEQFITKDLFEIATRPSQKMNCLEKMTRKVIRLKYVSNHYLNQILEREKLSSTAFNNFAIPHTIKMTAKKTCFNILINKEGIEWDGNKVQLVIMMCFSQNDRSIFNDFFEQLTTILSQPSNIKKLIRQQNYSEFVDCLVNCYDKQ